MHEGPRAQRARISFSKIPVGFHSKEQITSSEMQPMGKKVGGATGPHSKLDGCRSSLKWLFKLDEKKCSKMDVKRSVSMQTDTAMGANLWRNSFPVYDHWEALLVFTKRKKETSKHNCVFVSQLSVAGRHNCTKHLLLSAVRTPCVFELAWSQSLTAQ